MAKFNGPLTPLFKRQLLNKITREELEHCLEVYQEVYHIVYKNGYYDSLMYIYEGNFDDLKNNVAGNNDYTYIIKKVSEAFPGENVEEIVDQCLLDTGEWKSSGIKTA